MKQQIEFAIIVFAAMLIGGVAAAIADETITMTGNNGGRSIDATATANVIAISPPARLVSIANTGDASVFVAVRVTGAEFATMLASTNAIPIPSGASFEFVGGDPIDTIVIKSQGATTNACTIGVQR